MAEGGIGSSNYPYEADKIVGVDENLNNLAKLGHGLDELSCSFHVAQLAFSAMLVLYSDDFALERRQTVIVGCELI